MMSQFASSHAAQLQPSFVISSEKDGNHSLTFVAQDQLQTKLAAIAADHAKVLHHQLYSIQKRFPDSLASWSQLSPSNSPVSSPQGHLQAHRAAAPIFLENLQVHAAKPALQHAPPVMHVRQAAPKSHQEDIRQHSKTGGEVAAKKADTASEPSNNAPSKATPHPSKTKASTAKTTTAAKTNPRSFWTVQSTPLADEAQDRAVEKPAVKSSLSKPSSQQQKQQHRGVTLLSSSSDDDNDVVPHANLLISSDDELFPQLDDEDQLPRDAQINRSDDEDEDEKTSKHAAATSLKDDGDEDDAEDHDDTFKKPSTIRDTKRDQISKSAFGTWVEQDAPKRRRVIIKKKRVLDEKGYYVMKEVEEEVEEEEVLPSPIIVNPPPPPPPKPAAKPKSTTSNVSKPTADIRNWFTK